MAFLLYIVKKSEEISNVKIFKKIDKIPLTKWLSLAIIVNAAEQTVKFHMEI